MRLATLVKRSEFQRVRGGGRAQTAAFVLEGKARPPVETTATTDELPLTTPTTAPTGARFGFTITKKVGNAVVRNRMRRRLKAVFTALLGTHADPTYDYVVVARPPAFDQDFQQLTTDARVALDRVHGRKPARPDDRGRAGGRGGDRRSGRRADDPPPPTGSH